MTTTVQEAATKLNKLKARLTAIEKERSGVERDFREAAVEAAGGSADASAKVAELRARRVELAEEREVLEAAVAPAEAELAAARARAQEAAEIEAIRQTTVHLERAIEAAGDVDAAMVELTRLGRVFKDRLDAVSAMGTVPDGDRLHALLHPSILDAAGAAAGLKAVFFHLAPYGEGSSLLLAAKGRLRLNPSQLIKAGLA